MSNLERKYEQRYKSQDAKNLYPTEFVVRAFLGTYPHLESTILDPATNKILDLGFGDGRNIPFLCDLGLDVSGVEITEIICETVAENLSVLNYAANLLCGRNNGIPFADETFDHLLACHSCYYVDRGTHFSDNIAEMARVLKPGARLVCSLQMTDSYLFKNGIIQEEGHIEVTEDPYNLRNGNILRAFGSKGEIKEVFGSHFEKFQIGSCRNDWWGIEEYAWIVICHKISV